MKRIAVTLLISAPCLVIPNVACADLSLSQHVGWSGVSNGPTGTAMVAFRLTDHLDLEVGVNAQYGQWDAPLFETYISGISVAAPVGVRIFFADRQDAKFIPFFAFQLGYRYVEADCADEKYYCSELRFHGGMATVDLGAVIRVHERVGVGFSLGVEAFGGVVHDGITGEVGGVINVAPRGALFASFGF